MNNNNKQGLLYALTAYSLWGIAPIYFKQLVDFPAIEILMHRIIWSALILLLLIGLLKQWKKVRNAIRNRKVMLTLLASSMLIGANWLLFIWSVNSGYLLEASLGYYINPLFSVLLGLLFFSEQLSKLQILAVLFAIIGVLFQFFLIGNLPWIAIVLAGSFAIYGMLRKKVDIDSLPGLLIETTILLPVAIVYWILFASPASNLFANEFSNSILLLASGLITIIPLLCFTAAAKRIALSTLGFMQYIGPTIMFLLAINIYGESFSKSKFLSFCFIWFGLIVFTFDVFQKQRKH